MKLIARSIAVALAILASREGRALAATSEDAPIAPLPPPGKPDAPFVVKTTPWPAWTPPYPRVELAADVAAAFPIGRASSAGPAMGDVTAWQLPIGVEIGLRVIPWLFVGGYGSFAWGASGGAAAGTCATDPRGLSCATHTGEAGFVVRARLRPVRERFFPWVGYGIGYEWLSSDVFSASGLTLARVTAGVEAKLDDDLAVGPFVRFDLGQYGTASSADVGDHSVPGALHGWASIGVKVAYDL